MIFGEEVIFLSIILDWIFYLHVKCILNILSYFCFIIISLICSLISLIFSFYSYLLSFMDFIALNSVSCEWANFYLIVIYYSHKTHNEFLFFYHPQYLNYKLFDLLLYYHLLFFLYYFYWCLHLLTFLIFI